MQFPLEKRICLQSGFKRYNIISIILLDFAFRNLKSTDMHIDSHTGYACRILMLLWQHIVKSQTHAILLGDIIRRQMNTWQ